MKEAPTRHVEDEPDTKEYRLNNPIYTESKNRQNAWQKSESANFGGKWTFYTKGHKNKTV